MTFDCRGGLQRGEACCMYTLLQPRPFLASLSLSKHLPGVVMRTNGPRAQLARDRQTGRPAYAYCQENRPSLIALQFCFWSEWFLLAAFGLISTKFEHWFSVFVELSQCTQTIFRIFGQHSLELTFPFSYIPFPINQNFKIPPWNLTK